MTDASSIRSLPRRARYQPPLRNREEKDRAFKEVAFQINRRLQLFTSLPLEKLDRLKLAALTSEIGSKETELGAGG